MRAGIAFALALALAPGAAAQEDAERTALARSLFRQGIELSDLGRWEEAADRFRRSLSLHGSAVAEFNLGTALTHTGHLLEATERFRRAARDEDAPPELAQAARAQLEALSPRLGRLTVEVGGARETVSLELDGDPLPAEAVGIAAPADPGHHVLRALRDGDEVARAEVDVPEGGAQRVSLEIPPPAPTAEEAARSVVASTEPVAPTAPLSPAPAPPPAGGGDELAIWIGVVAGIVAVGAAVALATYFVLAGQGSTTTVPGNLSPAVISFR